MRHLAHIRDRQPARWLRTTAGVLGGVLVMAAACSDTSESADRSSAGSDADDGIGEGAGSTGGGAADSDGYTGDPFGSTGYDDDNEGDTDGGDESSGGDSGGEVPPPEAGPHPPCPDPLPEGWLFCEDFEGLADPTTVFFDYVDSDGNFVPVFDGGASGIGAMRAHYREGVEGAGFMSVSFGANPINTTGRPGYSNDSNFDEIYWRFRVKTQPGWPDVGPHNLTRLSAFAQSDWGQAVVASLASRGDDVMLEGTASSCVYDGQVACAGVDDTESLEPLSTLTGTTPVFSSERAGKWQCIEARVKLNAPGDSDGVFQLWVDGRLEGDRSGLDWRGSWSEFGLNLLSIENLWVGGAPADLDRWFDDLVISTHPIGC